MSPFFKELFSFDETTMQLVNALSSKLLAIVNRLPKRLLTYGQHKYIQWS